jgi:2-polyprenyl-3-methyl-5-hydroxy-6-metoxy-1,4-benzoquinol methylase
VTKEYVCPILDRSTPVDETGISRDSWSLVRCRETGFVFLADPPDYAELESEFAWEETSTAERKRREQDEPLASRVSWFAKRAKIALFPRRNKVAELALEVARGSVRSDPLHLLDVGCGWGHLMVDIHDRLAQVGRKVVPRGIEVSKRLAAASARRVSPLGGNVLLANALDGIQLLEPESIDLVIMSSFLEHECRPLCVLRQLRPKLRSSGAVIVKVPNFACWNRILRGRKWCGFRFPDHVNYFTPGTLRRLAREAGFTVSRQKLLDRFPLSDSMYAILTI